MKKSPEKLADRLKSWLALGKIWLTPGMGVKRWLIGLVTGTPFPAVHQQDQVFNLLTRLQGYSAKAGAEQ